MSNVFDQLLSKFQEAPFGFKKDGQPRKRPPRQPPQKTEPINETLETPNFTPGLDGKILKRLNKLEKLGDKSIRKLSELLDDPDKRIRLQAAGVATRASIMGMSKEALQLGLGAEIHIHTTVQVATTTSPGADGAQASSPVADHQGDGGKPVMIVK